MLLLMVCFFLLVYYIHRTEADIYIFHGCKKVARVLYHLFYGIVKSVCVG
uniref:Uncharacterized protein n=1 Tax=Setaria italica TaxID=4555 RepID=K4A4B8_SETIT